MERRIYHGPITIGKLSQALQSAFHRHNYQCQVLGDDEFNIVQISTRQWLKSGGQTAITINLQPHPDGVLVQIGKQGWIGVAASLGRTAISALINPWSLVDRLDDIAQDVESIQLSEAIWKVIEDTVAASGASLELSERFKRTTCPYCMSANPLGEANCVSCGAPLGQVQSNSCKKCGFLIQVRETICPNCGVLIN